MNIKIFLFIIITLLLTSCKVKEKPSELNYMQNVEQIAIETALQNSVSTIQVGDQIMILVTAKDMDVVKPFNQNYSSSETSQTTIPAGNIPTQGQFTTSGPIYTVDSEGNIDFPIIGKVSTTGKSLVAFKDELRNELTRYIRNPTVNMKITNYKITILGEVAKPGQYTISDGQATLLNAIGLAGDLTIYGKRENVLVVRNENGQLIKERINLMDANFFNSPYYQLKQGDLIYISANQTQDKASRLDPNMPIYISVAGIVVTILAVVFRK